jgi:hypothetical protein
MSLKWILPLVGAAVAFAQAPGTFTPTGSMLMPGVGHQAILLLDGRVLVVGGGGTSAEVYDPSTGTFSATGEMNILRAVDTATLLPDGRVLVTDGPAEIYDPATGAFTVTGTMATRHWRATLLNNGKVLMTGGYTQSTPSTVPDAEIYDPSTGTFSIAGADANTADIYYSARSATLLPDGTVLVTGVPRLFPPSGEIYDPATGKFRLTGSMNVNTGAGTATLLTNGKVLVAGGTDNGDFPLGGAQLYDPSTGVFTDNGYMTTGRDVFSATLIPDGTVLIAGGAEDRPYHDASLYTSASAELYDISSGTFRSIGNMTVPRYSFAASLLNDGRVLIAGGYYWAGPVVPPPTFLSSAEIYTPPVLSPPPALFSVSGDGSGQGAILHTGTDRIASAGDPAITGEVLEVYGRGLIEGAVVPPQVVIGGRMAEVVFFGKAPGFENLNQINVRVPDGVVPGPAISVRLRYLGRHSNEVTIGIR